MLYVLSLDTPCGVENVCVSDDVKDVYNYYLTESRKIDMKLEMWYMGEMRGFVEYFPCEQLDFSYFVNYIIEELVR